jgi:hypothetical protein
MKTAYYFHSPRGFSNEADVYAVPAEIAEQWLETFEARLGSSADYAATAVVSISRQDAERLIRRDGVGLQINSHDYNWEDCTEKKLTPASLRSARRAATAMIAEIKREMDSEAERADAYPEFAVTPR